MSSKSDKQVKEAGGKRAETGRNLLQKPAGPVPTAQVMARHSGNMITRSSRGFSYGELESSGVAMATVKRWGLQLDLRRRSVLDHNVEALRKWYPRAKQVEKPGEVKKLEKELEKIGKEAEKEVKKGAARAKKEAVKAEKEVKKAEKEVVEKVEEPVKARRGRKKASKTSEKDTSSREEES